MLIQINNNNNNNNNNNQANMDLGHFLTLVSCIQKSLMVSPGSFCFLVCNILLSTVNYDKAFCVYVATNFFFVFLYFVKINKQINK
jgi:hypothetical protein